MQAEPTPSIDALVFETLTPDMYKKFQSFVEELSPETYRDATNIPRESFVNVIYQQLSRRTTVIVGKKANDVISFGMLTVSKSLSSNHNREARIAGLIVRTDLQGRGIGSLTVKQLLKIAEGRGCRKVTLLVLKNNKAVIKFYQKHGFKITKEKQLLNADGENTAVNLYEMEKTTPRPTN